VIEKDDSKSLGEEIAKLKKEKVDGFIMLGNEPQDMPLVFKWCLEMSSVECLVYLIKSHGCKIDYIQSGTLNTALHIAASKNNLKLVEALIRLGAQVDALNKDNQSAWELATEPAVVAILKN
jgi:hypothetical protein